MILCNSCHTWIHYECTNLPVYQLSMLMMTNRKYTCQKCALEDNKVRRRIDEIRINEQMEDATKEEEEETMVTEEKLRELQSMKIKVECLQKEYDHIKEVNEELKQQSLDNQRNRDKANEEQANASQEIKIKNGELKKARDTIMKLEKTINDQMENIKLLEIKLQIAESKGKTTEEILSNILDNP